MKSDTIHPQIPSGRENELRLQQVLRCSPVRKISWCRASGPSAVTTFNIGMKCREADILLRLRSLNSWWMTSVRSSANCAERNETTESCSTFSQPTLEKRLMRSAFRWHGVIILPLLISTVCLSKAGEQDSTATAPTIRFGPTLRSVQLDGTVFLSYAYSGSVDVDLRLISSGVSNRRRRRESAKYAGKPFSSFTTTESNSVADLHPHGLQLHANLPIIVRVGNGVNAFFFSEIDGIGDCWTCDEAISPFSSPHEHSGGGLRPVLLFRPQQGPIHGV